MSKKFQNMDADESIFFARELESVKAKSYDVQYPLLKARKLFPVSGEAGPGAETIKYEQYDMVGMAKLISSYADDLPRADVKGKEFISSVKSLGASYGYNLQEIRAAKMAGKPLAVKRANAAKESVLRKEDYLAFYGDSDNNIQGFFSNANISNVTPITGTWSGATADQILADLNKLVNSVSEATKGVETPDTLLLPLTLFNIVSTKRIGVDSNMTVLKYFLETTPYIKSVDWLNQLETAGTGSTKQAMVYNRNPDKLTMEIPQDFEQLEEQSKGLEYVVPCHSRFGGVLVYYPLSVAKMYGL